MSKTLFTLLVCLMLSVSTNAQTNVYTGTSDGDQLRATLTWPREETIYGNYYFLANPSRIYGISGTNYVEGQVNIDEFFNGRRTGSGTLFKTLKKGRIVWSGYIYNTNGTQSYLYLSRPR